MGLITVTGGPTAPSDRTLQSATLSATLHGYTDGAHRYPPKYRAVWDSETGGWKPQGSPDGTAWLIPGALPGEPEPPETRFVETQVYADDPGRYYSMVFTATVTADASGEWDYTAGPAPTPEPVPPGRDVRDYGAKGDVRDVSVGFTGDPDRVTGAFSASDAGMTIKVPDAVATALHGLEVTVGNNIIHSTGSRFHTWDLGKRMTIAGAGPSGSALETRVVEITDIGGSGDETSWDVRVADLPAASVSDPVAARYDDADSTVLSADGAGAILEDAVISPSALGTVTATLGTDDTAAVQDALDACAPGEAVLFLSGTSFFHDVALVSGQSAYFAAGAGAAMLGASIPPDADPDDTHAPGFFVAESPPGARITDLRVTGGDFDGHGVAENVLRGTACDRVTVTGVTARRMFNTPVWLYESTDLTLTGGDFTDGQYGALLWDHQWATIAETSIVNPARNAFLFYHSPGAGVGVEAGRLRFDRSSREGRGIDTTDILVRDCAVTGANAERSTGRADIVFYGCRGGSVHDTSLSGGYGEKHLRSRDSEDIDFINCATEGGTGIGIAYESLATYLGQGLVGGGGTCEGNAISGATVRGISAQAATAMTEDMKPVTVRRNTIRNVGGENGSNPADGICYGIAGGTIEANSIEGCQASGIVLAYNGSVTKAQGVRVSGNTVKDIGTGTIGAELGSAVYATGTGHVIEDTHVIDTLDPPECRWAVTLGANATAAVSGTTMECAHGTIDDLQLQGGAALLP